MNLICNRMGLVILVVATLAVALGYTFESYHGEKKRGVTYFVLKKDNASLWWELVKGREGR